MASASKCDIYKRYYDDDTGAVISVQLNLIDSEEPGTIWDLCPSHKMMLIRMLNGNDTVSFYEVEEK